MTKVLWRLETSGAILTRMKGMGGRAAAAFVALGSLVLFGAGMAAVGSGALGVGGCPPLVEQAPAVQQPAAPTPIMDRLAPGLGAVGVLAWLFWPARRRRDQPAGVFSLAGSPALVSVGVPAAARVPGVLISRLGRVAPSALETARPRAALPY